MRPLGVLVTAAGAPGTAALVRALRANGEREIRLVGCDMRERAIGRLLCDAFRQVPPGSSPLFPEAVLQLCRRERIDAVLPQSSHELPGLARAKADFAAAGIALLVPSPEAVRTATDRLACYALLDEHGVRVPSWRRARGGRELARAAAELGYPRRAVCFTPAVSADPQSVRVLDPTVDRSRRLLSERPADLGLRLEEVTELLPEVGGDELLVMELVEGGERAIDGIAAGGRLLLGSARTGEAIAGGRATYFETVLDESLLEVGRRVVAALSLDHLFSCQLVGDVVIEVSPRVSTVVYQEDLNLPYLGIKRALGELDAAELAAYGRRARQSRRALRYVDQIEWDD